MRYLIPLLLLPSIALGLSPKAQSGKAVMEKAQCNRCHPISHATDGIAPAVQEMHCVDCHTWILGTKGDPKRIAEMRVDFPDWDRYLENIVHFIRLPDLGTLTRKVRPAFVRSFLDGPFDLRPHLDESMIPLRLSAAEKDAVVAYLSELAGAALAQGGAGPRPTDAQIAEGRTRFTQRGCPACHVMGNAQLLPGLTAAAYAKLDPVSRLAPNLRYVRDRIPRAVLERFISDPQSVDPKTAMVTMPTFGDDAARIADFLLFGPIETARRTAYVAPEVPLLSRKVAYDEIHDEVLGFVCVHCHMDPASNNGDGGAGNSGGLGYAGLALNLETYAGVKQGLVRDGKRVDILDPEAPGEPPLLLSVLLRRHREAGRDRRVAFTDAAPMGPPTDAKRPGMPLGLPPLTMRHLSLVKTWIAQGAPGPK